MGSVEKYSPFFYQRLGAHEGGIMQLSAVHGLAGHLVPGHMAGTLLPGIGQFTFPP
ncbi:hypothetical protein [Chryseobacterium piperi]|uniref:hypothetical protein n=1 Tax=Chryseobacterium piperi TaxID=558152 RepID=UPI0012FDF75A|nr:hypothetical protein [Chryseobacterium piperi]